MYVLALTKDFIFICCNNYELTNIEGIGNPQAVFIDESVYSIVQSMLEPKRKYYKKLLEEISKKDGTIRYWEENWHDRIVNEIVELTQLNRIDVSNSVSAFIENL